MVGSRASCYFTSKSLRRVVECKMHSKPSRGLAPVECTCIQKVCQSTGFFSSTPVLLSFSNQPLSMTPDLKSVIRTTRSQRHCQSVIRTTRFQRHLLRFAQDFRDPQNLPPFAQDLRDGESATICAGLQRSLESATICAGSQRW